jgi:hypothetical protein
MSSGLVSAGLGDLVLVDLDRVAHRLLLAFKIERLVAGDALRHFLDETLGDGAAARFFKRVVLDQQGEDARGEDLLGEIVRACEFERIALWLFKTIQMRGLRCARSLGCCVVRPALLGRGGLGDVELFAVIESEPRLPLRVRKGLTSPERVCKLWEFLRRVRVFREQRALLGLV